MTPEVHHLYLDLDGDGVREAVVVPQDEGFYSLSIFTPILHRGKPTGIEKVFQSRWLDNPDREVPVEVAREAGRPIVRCYVRTERGTDSSYVVRYNREYESYEQVK